MQREDAGMATSGPRRSPRATPAPAGYRLEDLRRRFGDDDSCLEYLWRTRFAADGTHAHCPKCDKLRVFRRYDLRSRTTSYTCTACGRHLHPTAGTIFDHSSTVLDVWFRAVYLVVATHCQITPARLQVELGVSLSTARRMCRRIATQLAGPAEKGQLRSGRGRGRSSRRERSTGGEAKTSAWTGATQAPSQSFGSRPHATQHTESGYTIGVPTVAEWEGALEKVAQPVSL